LKDSPDDSEYQQCFIISSLKISLADELGQSYFKSAPNNEALQQLYAYYLYDRGEFEKTVQYILSLKSTPKLKLLLAQSYFRAQNYEKSAELMISLLKDASLTSEERDEYMINLLADGLNRHLSADLIKEYEKVMIKTERKELLYNFSLIMFDLNEYKKCLAYLQEFEASLVEGRDDNDLAMVRLFKDFIEWNTNRSAEKGVIDAYERMLEKVTDKNVTGVLENNLLFYRQGQGQITENTHEILKMFD
jgi:predicted Zn-dependent protease